MMERPPSLYELATQQCMRYAAFVVDIGELPYSVVKPFLAKLSHEQLALIESKSPHIVGESDELWREAIVREFRDRKVPLKNFRSTFQQYRLDKEAQLGAARERLKSSQEQYHKNKRAASVVALTEEELPMAQRAGSPRPMFNSRIMQTVARRTQANMLQRKPPGLLPPKLVKVESVAGVSARAPSQPHRPKPAHQQVALLGRHGHAPAPHLSSYSLSAAPGASESPLGSPPMSPPLSTGPPPPPAAAPMHHPLAASPPYHDPHTYRPAPLAGAKRKRVSSVFIRKR